MRPAILHSITDIMVAAAVDVMVVEKDKDKAE